MKKKVTAKKAHVKRKLVKPTLSSASATKPPSVKPGTLKKSKLKPIPTKKVKKVVEEKETKKSKSSNLPIFNKNDYVRLSDLARELNIDYRSCFLKQKRHGIFSLKCLEDGREVVCFDNINADKIRSTVAPFINPSLVELKKLEEECNVDRAKMLLILARLSITPEKRRRHEKTPRSVLTVKKNLVKRIKQAVKSLE